MTTATALDPVSELEQTLTPHGGDAPFITIAGEMALVSYDAGGQVHTEVWLHGDRGWRMRGSHTTGL
jgi:hypothetical protein